MKLKTNQGKIFDFFLNSWVNLVLWWNGIGVWEETDQTDQGLAMEITAREVKKFQKIFNI